MGTSAAAGTTTCVLAGASTAATESASGAGRIATSAAGSEGSSKAALRVGSKYSSKAALWAGFVAVAAEANFAFRQSIGSAASVGTARTAEPNGQTTARRPRVIVGATS